ncbi:MULTISPECIES: hypothetical protein [unclassified Rubrivirga]|uniref:hypothetical protein n=1 Tax=unclassified Rubrivirga TaxID=2640460 RepID=UPI00398FF0DE
MLSVPFATGDVHGGLSEGRGSIHVEGDEVVIEVQVKVLGMFDRGAQSFRFELTDLEEVRHKRGWFGDTLTLRTRPMDLVSRVPGASEGCLALKVKRRNRDALDALLDRFDLWMT